MARDLQDAREAIELSKFKDTEGEESVILAVASKKRYCLRM